MNLLLLEAAQLRGTRAALSAIQARHARDVLRVVPGQDLRVGLIDGPRGIGRVVRADDSVELECTFEAELPPIPDVDLLEAGHWSEADKWLTEKYIQPNPNFASGREPIMKAFGGRGPGRRLSSR